MNTLVLIMGLVGLSYLSGLFGRGRAVRGLGLPSGGEWLVVGFLLGPGLLGVIDHAVQTDVEPVLYVALGWVALVVGLDYGVVRSRRLRPIRMLLGIALGVLTVGAVALAAWLAIPYLYLGISFTALERAVLALGLGAVAGETTSHAVQWVAEHHGRGGPLAELLDDLAEAKDIVPILVAGVALCLHPRFAVADPTWLTTAAIPAAVMGMGALLGAVAAVMLSREKRADQAWGIVVGIGLLATGTVARLRLPVVSPLFALGLALGIASRHRDRLRAMIGPTQRSALLPALLLAGARISPQVFLQHGIVVAVVLVVRAATLYASGHLVARSGRAKSAVPLLGWAMMPAGELSMSIGLSFALTFPPKLGEPVLLAAALVTLVGEIVGTLALRAALGRAGELDPAPVAHVAAT